MQNELSKAVDEVLSWVPANGTVMEKVKAVHDWLVRNVEYNTYAERVGYDNYGVTPTDNPWSAYGALVNHSAVCQGYSLAMTEVLNKLEINCEYCYSTTASHVWNTVQVLNNDRFYYNERGELIRDGSDSVWLNVDVTWDDPVPDGGFSRTPSSMYFLKSNKYMRTLYDGTHDDWNAVVSCYRCPCVDYDQNLFMVENFPDEWPTYSGPVTPNASNMRQDISGAVVSPIPDQPYDGLECHPLVKVTLNGKLLNNAEDYHLFYSDNVEVGQGTITIRGRNGYKGEVEATFDIVDQVDLEACDVEAIPDHTYTGNAIKPELNVTYDPNVSFGIMGVSDYNYTTTFKNNTNVGTAQVRLDATDDGWLYGSKTVTFKIVPADIAGVKVASIPQQTYTGKAITPGVTMTFNGKPVDSQDYALTYKDNTKVGTATVTITGRRNFAGTRTTTFTIEEKSTPTPDPPAPTTQEMFRLYNPNSGEHFYTASSTEKNALVKLGWKYEGVGWVAPVKSNTPVYRLYNPVVGDHHYTTDVKERDALVNKHKWTYEGIGWYSDDAKGTPLYRQYNPNARTGSHNYTTDTKERDALVKKYGWIDEGVGWHGVK